MVTRIFWYKDSVALASFSIFNYRGGEEKPSDDGQLEIDFEYDSYQLIDNSKRLTTFV